jgi:hypothetical protein
VWGNNRHLPGDEAWLVGQWRSGGERKYYLSNLPADTPLRALAAAIKGRRKVSRRTSSSSKNSGWGTSKVGPGPACTDTRCELHRLRLPAVSPPRLASPRLASPAPGVIDLRRDPGLGSKRADADTRRPRKTRRKKEGVWGILPQPSLPLPATLNVDWP